MRQQVAQQQVGGGLDPHVDVVAHGHALGGQREHVYRSGTVQRLGQCRTERVAQEPETLDGLLGVHPEPRDRPRPLVEAGVGRGAASLDGHHVHGGAGPDGAGHGHHRGVLIGRLEPDLSALQHALGRVAVRDPPLGHDRGTDRAPERVAHFGPADGRAAVKDRARLETVDDRAGRLDTEQHRRTPVEAVDDFGVGRVDPVRGRTQQPGQGGHRLGVTTGRDAPVHPNRWRALIANRRLEPLEPDVDDRDPLGQLHYAHLLGHRDQQRAGCVAGCGQPEAGVVGYLALGEAAGFGERRRSWAGGAGRSRPPEGRCAPSRASRRS